jgi:hypothetical protein
MSINLIDDWERLIGHSLSLAPTGVQHTPMCCHRA